LDAVDDNDPFTKCAAAKADTTETMITAPVIRPIREAANHVMFLAEFMNNSPLRT
jgi:hypothetical protein